MHGSTPAGALCAVSTRHTEQRVEPVARELRDGAAKAFDLAGDQADDLVEEELRALRSEALADRGGVGDVREQNRDDPPLSARHRHAAIMPLQPASPDDHCRVLAVVADPRAI